MLQFLLPETATAPAKARRRYAWRSTGLAAIIAASLVGLIRCGLPPVPVLLALGLAMGLGVYEFVRLITSLDELQQRVHILALAIAGGFASLGVLFIGLFTLAGFVRLDGLDGGVISLVFPAYFLVYYAALFVVSRRYT